MDLSGLLTKPRRSSQHTPWLLGASTLLVTQGPDNAPQPLFFFFFDEHTQGGRVLSGGESEMCVRGKLLRYLGPEVTGELW